MMDAVVNAPEMVRSGLHAWASDIRAEDAASRAQWEAETESGYPMIPVVELSLAFREFVATCADALADSLGKVLITYVLVVAVACILSWVL